MKDQLPPLRLAPLLAALRCCSALTLLGFGSPRVKDLSGVPSLLAVDLSNCMDLEVRWSSGCRPAALP